MFDNYISLGYWCGSAASMEKLGIRGFSSPFDWLVTPSFCKVLECIENDFIDFLDKNIASETYHFNKDNGHWEFQNKYGFLFWHDAAGKNDLENKFNSITLKYQHRIEKFRKAVRDKTCFIRMISTNDSKFIEHNKNKMENCNSKLNSFSKKFYGSLTMRTPYLKTYRKGIRGYCSRVFGAGCC